MFCVFYPYVFRMFSVGTRGAQGAGLTQRSVDCGGLGGQTVPGRTCDRRAQDLAFGVVGGKGDFGELGCPAKAGGFDQDVMGLTDLCGEVAG